MDWKNIIERALWTFAEGFLVALPAASSLGLDAAAWKAEGALGLVKKDTGIQAVYGPKADVLKSDINDIL